jgi:predicted nucleic acid-binding protein
VILLDTDILSELMRPDPEPAVERWLAAQPDASVFITAITEAELRYGAALPKTVHSSGTRCVSSSWISEPTGTA